MRMLMVLPPLVQLLLFGYAVNLDVDKVSIAWMDRDLTAESRDILGAFQGSGRFEVVALPDNDGEVRHLLDSGKVQGVVRIFPGFARDIQRGETALDGLDSGSSPRKGVEVRVLFSALTQSVGYPR
jgi:ABC-2 type transport system permease protein